MKTIKLRNLSFRYYTEAHEVPVENLHLLHKYALYSAGIGHGSDIGTRFQKLLNYLSKEDLKNAVEETNNLMAAYFLTLKGIDPESLSLCCLVHSVDGVVVNDYSEENLNNMLKRFSKAGLSKVQLSNILEEVKKNFDYTLALKFPKYFNNDDEDYYYSQKIQWLVMSAKKQLGEDINTDDIEQYFYDLSLPKNFNDEDPLSCVNQLDKGFERMCANLQKHIAEPVEKINAVKFYSLLESFEKKPKH